MITTDDSDDSRRFTCFTLDNGLRCVCIADPSARAELCGLLVGAGSRDDPPQLHGMAHFVEHTIFKGTMRRSAWHINNRMESIGGELNAFTTKEETTIYSTFPAGNLPRAMELLADLVANATFPARDIDTERDVICDEIDSYRDTPAEAVYDDFEDELLAGSDLGHNILGTRESVARITSADCRRFVDTHYTPGRMVMFYSGPTPAGRVERIASRYLGAICRPDTPPARTAPPAVAREPFDIVRTSSNHQHNVAAGVITPGMYGDDRLALSLLCNITGGPGMNSLLNLSLRERMGLVYSVDSSLTLYADCGVFAVTYGCDPADTQRCRRAVARIFADTLPRFLTPRHVEAARRQLAGQMAVSADNRETLAFRTARAVSCYGAPQTDAMLAARLQAVTVEQLRDVASALLAPARFSSLTL